MDTDFPLNVIENEDGSLTIEWDENHPRTSMFNNFTEQDFLRLLQDECLRILGQQEYDRIKQQQHTED
jgi:hypothetical protein